MMVVVEQALGREIWERAEVTGAIDPVSILYLDVSYRRHVDNLFRCLGEMVG